MLKQRIHNSVRTNGRKVVERVAPTLMASASKLPYVNGEVNRLTREVHALRTRVNSLEAEVQETRRLYRHVAEVTDLVQEVLLPASQRDEKKFREELEKYAESL